MATEILAESREGMRLEELEFLDSVILRGFVGADNIEALYFGRRVNESGVEVADFRWFKEGERQMTGITLPVSRIESRRKTVTPNGYREDTNSLVSYSAKYN